MRVCVRLCMCAQKAADADGREGGRVKPPARGVVPSCEEQHLSQQNRGEESINIQLRFLCVCVCVTNTSKKKPSTCE